MTTYTIDTAEAIESLKAAGLTNGQARAIVEIFAESQGELATRNDIRELKSEIQALDAKLEAQGAHLEGRIDALGVKLEAQGAHLEGRIDALDVKLEAQGANLEGKFDALRADIGSMEARLQRKQTILQVAIATVLVGVLSIIL